MSRTSVKKKGGERNFITYSGLELFVVVLLKGEDYTCRKGLEGRIIVTKIGKVKINQLVLPS